MVVIHADDFLHVRAVRHVLAPLGPSGDGRYRAGVADRTRDELVDWWDHSVFLRVDVATSLRRKARRDGLSLDSSNPLTRRYVEGQRLYLDRCLPIGRATWVIDNGDAVDASVRPGSHWVVSHFSDG